MRSKKRVILYVFGILLLCVAAGCTRVEGNKDTETTDTQNLSGDLGLMQGAWESDSSEGMFSCEVRVEGCFLRLFYLHDEGGQLIRLNSFFERVDEQEKCFIKHDDSGAWAYDLKERAGQVVMSLEFYCNTCGSWHAVEFHRKQNKLTASG